jgi:plasmid maintenance system killer protein
MPPDPNGHQRLALRKLKYMNNAADLNDLRMPPGNRLEALTGDREGQHSIRSTINTAAASCGKVRLPFTRRY